MKKVEIWKKCKMEQVKVRKEKKRRMWGSWTATFVGLDEEG